MSSWTVSGRLMFRAKRKGSRFDIERDAERVAMEIAGYAAEKYPDYIFETPATAIYQPISEQVRS